MAEGMEPPKRYLTAKELRISVKVATCFGFKVATPRSAATLVWLGWVSGFFPSRVL